MINTEKESLKKIKILKNVHRRLKAKMRCRNDKYIEKWYYGKLSALSKSSHSCP